MKNLVVIGHPDKNSFCYSGIFKTICTEISAKKEELEKKDLMDTGDAVPESTRQAISVTPTRGMDMFVSRESAEERAKQIGCQGSHSHEIEGMTYYMPCSSHESYENSKKAYIHNMVCLLYTSPSPRDS